MFNENNLNIITAKRKCLKIIYNIHVYFFNKGEAFKYR